MIGLRSSSWDIVRKVGWCARIVLALVASASATVAAETPPDQHGQFVTQAFTVSGDFQAVHVEDRDHVSLFELAGNYDKNLGDGSVNVEPRAVIAREFYRTHRDEYDFLVVFTTFEFATPSNTPGSDALAFHLGVRNDVQGIGLPEFDNSDLFGSDGRLQGYVDMAALTRYVTDPLNPGFELVMSTLAHEMMHQWCCYVQVERADGSFGPDLLGPDDAHWSYLLDSDASVMYGHDWRDNGDGSFTAVDIRRFFSPLDLYLAGLLDASEVQPFLLIEQPAIARTEFPQRGAKITGTPLTVDVADVVAAEGPRLPSVADSPKQFRAAFLIVSRPGVRPTDEMVASVNRIRDAYQTRFTILTGGRATAQVFPETTLDGETGLPGGLGGGPLRDEASLVDGFTWLRSRQAPEGFWEDREATRVRDTAVALETLAAFDGSFAGTASALSWLSSQDGANLDFVARQASTLGHLGGDAAVLRATIASLQNADGGWGAGPQYGSDPVDTALAVQSLVDRPEGTPTVLDEAAAYLLSTQNPDGGWGNLRSGPSRTRATTTVVRALDALDRLTPVRAAALSWLAAKQNLDGGFGDSPSTVHDTADVVQLFADLDESPSIQSDSAYLFLRSRQSLEGSWDGSAYATALALRALQGGSFPNLRFTAPLVLVPASPRDGERAEVTVSIGNDGGTVAPSFLLRLYDGDPDAGGTPSGPDVVVPALPANRTAVVRLSWDSFDKPGPRTIVAVLDPERTITELSELDNRASLDVDVQEAPDEADLELRSTDVSILPAAPNRLPTVLAITAQLRNNGRTQVAEARVRLWEGPVGTGNLVDEKTVPIPERSSRAVNFSAPLGSPGTTVFTLEADPDDELAEANEGNNVAAASVTTVPSLDLEVLDSDLSLASGTPYLGNDVTFEAHLRNMGTLDAPPANVRLSVTDGTTTEVLATRSVVLGAGESAVQTADWRVSLLGTLRFTIELDTDGVIPELDETNNVASFAFNVSEIDTANLAVSYRDLGFDPSPGLEGAPLRLSALVRNTGVVTATDVEVGFYDGDPLLGGALLGTAVVPSLDAGASTTVEVIAAAVAPGEHLFFAVVDPDDRVAEFDEGDNRAFQTLRVLTLPDVAVSPGSLELVPRFPRPGDLETLTVRVTNLGEQPALGVVVRAIEGELTTGTAVGADQVLAEIAAKDTGTVSFTWTLADGDARPVNVIVDPDGLIVESTKANNTARIDVAVQSSDFYLTERYFSPNGDGVQDTTTFFYRLQSTETVAVEAVDERGRVVRRSSESAAMAGQFEWDGLDDRGRLARDGDYHLRVVRGADVLGQVLVTLDTDRSSLLEALGTPFELGSNLTCDLTNPSELIVSPDEQWVYFPLYSDPFYATGIYRMTPYGGDITRISDFTPTGPILISPNDTYIAYVAYRYVAGSYRYQVWMSRSDGSGSRMLRDSTSYYEHTPLGFIENGKSLLVARHSGNLVLEAIPTDGSASRIIASFPFPVASDFTLSPRGDRLLIRTYLSGFGYQTQVVNLTDGSSTPLGRSGDSSFSPDGSRIAVVGDWIDVYDAEGVLRRQIDVPVEPFPQELLPPDSHINFDGAYLSYIRPISWSRSGTEIAFMAEYYSYEAFWSRLFRADLISGELEGIGWTEVDESEGESYHVSTWDGSGYTERGVLHYGMQYRDQELDLTEYLPDASGEYRVLIRQTGREAAHVDRIVLRVGSQELAPDTARMVADGRDVLEEVQYRDSEVLDMHEAAVELSWHGLPPAPVTLVLRAREESLRGKNVRPFLYPPEDERFYNVAVHPDSPMTVDGVQTGEDGLGEPLFEELSRPGTGHPAAVVRGFAKSDGEFLYGALDFTVDNTLDGERDWASMLVGVDGEWREFRVTVRDSRWGVAGFAKTGRVSYPHKYYEFKIPLADLDANASSVLQVRFEAYGTAAIVDVNPLLLPLYGRLLWVPNERSLLYASEYSARPSVAIFLDEDNRRQDVLGDWGDIYNHRFSPTGRRLLFYRSVTDVLDPCYGRGYSDQWALSSLANLTADLRARRSSSTGGIRLDGTATDLHFSSYSLEYAPTSSASSFQLVQPPSAQSVIDDSLTTWIPPSAGTYFVRLTARDLAGNQRAQLKRISFSDTPSITDVYRTPEYISPNGDGVQDELLLHYRVLEPVHLEFRIVSEKGDRVRTIERDHSVAGTEFELAWNGIDDRGLPVKDGEYRVLVQNYEFFVHVDTLAPKVELSLLNAYQALVAPDGREFVNVAPQLDWCISDENLASYVVETGEGADPVAWPEYFVPKKLCLSDLSDEQRRAARRGMSLEDFVGHRFRLSASDRAGNRARVTTPLGAEELMVDGFGTPGESGVLPRPRYVPMSQDDGKPALFIVDPMGVRLGIKESLREELVELAIQFRPEGQAFWQETPVTEFLGIASNVVFPAPLDHRFEVRWSMEGVPLGMRTVVRLRGRDLSGKEFFSNTFQVLTDGIYYGGRLGGPGGDPGIVLDLVAEAHLRPDVVLWAIEAVPEPIADIKLFIRSETDPRYFNWHTLEPVKAVNGAMVFAWKDGEPCVEYSTFVQITTEPTALSDGTTRVRYLRSNSVTLKPPCLTVDMSVAPVPADSCGAAPAQKLLLTAFTRASSLNPPLQLLALGKDLGDGDIDVFFNENEPLPKQFYQFEYDTSDVPEGVYPWVGRLTDIAGTSSDTPFDLIVDHTPPVASINVPLEGQKVCGIQRMTPDGLRTVFDVEGVVEDGAGAGYRLVLEDVDGVEINKTFEKVEGLELKKRRGRLGTYGDELTEPPFSGDATVRLEVDDWGGHRVCVARTFYFDGEVDNALLSIDRVLFSPNGDGELDDVQVELSAAELFFASVDVFAAVETSEGIPRVTGPPLRQLESDFQVLDRLATVWDGRRDDGTIVPDGLYGVVGKFRDACGNVTSQTRFVVVDNTPPALAVTYPGVADPLTLMVEVRGTAADLHFARYDVGYGVGIDPTTFALFGAGVTPKLDELLAVWNTRGLEGDVTLRLQASDLAGNHSELYVPLLFDSRVDLVTYLEAVPNLFSPNGDGRRETTSLRFGLDEDATVTLAIHDLGGTLIRELVDHESMLAGAFVKTWDGRTAASAPAPDGEYEVRLEAVLASNASVVQRERVTVVVDTTPPVISLTRPNGGFLRRGGNAVGSVTDLHLKEYAVYLTDSPDAPVWDLLEEGSSNLTDASLASLAGLEEGEYALRVAAEDEAENRNEVVVPFIVDATPPRVSLTDPVSGAVLGGTALSPPVSGTLEEEYLALYRLEYGAGDAPSTFLPIASGTSLPLPDPIALWNLNDVVDGRYTLRLYAEDQAGQAAEARVLVDVDKTPPEVAIATPSDGSYVTEPLEILGTATDAHLTEYRLALAPGAKGTSTAFSEIGFGVSPVSDGSLLDWRALPRDGRYTLRLRAEDVVGLSAEALVEIEVDTTPPAPPIELQAEVENRRDARLTWTANAEPDLAGYNVYRFDQRINAALVPTPGYLDAGLEEGNYVYHVTAVDRAGNESDPSNDATVTVDITPPEAVIAKPALNERVSGIVDVIGTAYSQDDFKEYRLFADSELLRRSPVPVQADVLSQWSTVGLPEDAIVTLRLEAEDLTGNVATHSVQVQIDNFPPAAPTGLTATQQGTTSDVLVTWNANTEPDLLGYLLYRDGRLANADGVVVGELTRYVIKVTEFLDPDVPDGLHVYEVYAIDEAGNISDPSEPADVTLDTRPPHAVIIFPEDGTAFDSPLHVTATTEDTDVAEVQFQYRILGGAWIDLGAADTAVPWEIDWDPAGLDYDSYELQAVATDDGGRTDPAPTPITVHYRDVTRPGEVLNLTVHVNGGDARLEWEAVSDADLAGYHIDRRDELGTEVRITGSPIPDTTYLDADLDDGTYFYRVVAVDTSDNEGDPSNEEEAVVYTPLLEQPYTPTLELASDLRGSGAAFATVEGELESASGTTTLTPIETDEAGSFVFSDLALERGDNVVTVRIRDDDDNLSKDASVVIVSSAAPSAPVGLVLESPGGLDVSLRWTENPPAENVIGYRAFRNDEAVLEDELTSFASAGASSWNYYSPPNDAIDGNEDSYWAPYLDDPSEVAGESFTAEAFEQRILVGLQIDWYFEWWDESIVYAASDFDVEAWSEDAGAWVPVASIRGNREASNVITLDQPYRTDRLRVVLRNALRPTDYDPVRLAEIRYLDRPYLTSPPLEETVGDGQYRYVVTALNQYGFESAPSDPAELPVGDVEPPEPPTLTATVVASDVHLEWTASPSPDVVRYDLYRDGAFLAAHTDLGNLTYPDLGLQNGTYLYTAVAVDSAANESVPSNEAQAIVDVPPPSAPIDLVVTEVPEGRELDLAWAPGPGDLPVGYRVSRSLSSGGPYEDVGTTPETTFRDVGLTNGVTYYYVVVGLDALSNPSAFSNEASGTPHDVVPPEPPVLHYPGYPEAPFRTSKVRTSIVGSAEPAATVALARGGAVLGSTTALALPDTNVASFPVYEPFLSPTGRYLYDRDETRLFDFDTGSFGSTISVDGNVRYSFDGTELIISRDSSIWAYGISDQSLQEIATVEDFVDVAVPSPDGRSLAALAYDGGNRGLLLIDRATGAREVLVAEEPWTFESASIQWSPLGTHVVFQRWSPDNSLSIVDVETGEILDVEDAPVGYVPSWSPDGQSLLYGASRDGFDQIWRYDLAARIASPVTTEPLNHEWPQWSPDGRRFAFVVDNEVVARAFLSGEEETLFEGEPGSYPQIQWTRGGDLLVLEDGQATRLRPAGRFELRNVVLEPGDNVFTASATDDTGTESDPSEDMVVVLELESLPDLDVSLSVLPAAVQTGSEVHASVAVRNSGGASAAPVEISVFADGPGGFFRVLADRSSLGELSPGDLRAIYFDVALDGPAGLYRFQATVDPMEIILERSESNNAVERQVVAVDGELPSLTVATDEASYAAGGTVRATAEVFHGGDLFDGRLLLSIEDADGYEVTPLFNRAVTGLGFGGRRVESADWDSTTTFAGSYRVHARLADTTGAIVAEAFAPFTLRGSSALDASVQTDQLTYLLGATARISGAVHYGNGNELLRGLVARLRVVDASSQVLNEWNRPLGDLLPGGEGRVQADWPSGASGAGTFRAELAVLDGANVLETAITSFDVVLPAVALSGRLTLSDATPAAGTPVTALYQLANGGSSPLSALPVVLRVLDPGTGEIVAEFETTADVPVGGAASESHDFATEGLRLKPYFVTLSAQLPGDATPTKLHDASFTPVDETPPLVEIERPADGDISNGSINELVKAVDGLSRVEHVEVSLDGADWLPAAPASLADARYQRPFSIATDGEYLLRARATDTFENVGEAVPVRIIVDRTPPTIVITGVQDGEIYRSPVVPVIEITDLHLESQTILLNGAPFVSGTTVSIPGTYRIDVEAVDAAGNRSEESLGFEIEGTPSLVATKIDELSDDGNGDGDVGVGDVVRYTLEVENEGDGAATGVVVEDAIPEHATLVPGSISTSAGQVTSEDPVRIELGTLGAGAAAVITFEVLVDADLPPSVAFLANQATVTSAELADVLTDDPDTAEPDDATRTPVVHETDWIFTDETDRSGLGTRGIKTGGLAWCDFDSDGDLDLLVNTGTAEAEGRSYLYFNDGHGKFQDVTEELAAGLVRERAHRSAVCGDLDNDGYMDFVRNEHGRIEVYLNGGPKAEPPFSFGKTRKKSRPQEPSQLITKISGGMNTEGMGLLDFDNDGDLDLVVDNHDFGIDLFLNDGEGELDHATPNKSSRGFPTKAKSGDYLAVTDYDVDGWVDLIDRKEKQFDIWRNRGNGTVKANESFDEQANNANKGGVAFCDLDSDGDFDVVWTDFGLTQVFRNDGGTFRPTGEPSASSGIDLQAFDIDDVVCADVDNDSDLDLFFSASSGPSFLFFNETQPGSQSPFLFVRNNRNIAVEANGEAAAFADYDRDGDLDLVVNIDGAKNQLWESHRNDAGESDYLAVRVLRCMDQDGCHYGDHDGDDDHDDDDDDDGHHKHRSRGKHGDDGRKSRHHDEGRDDDDDDHHDDDDDGDHHGRGEVIYRDDIGATIRLLDANGLLPLGPIREVNGGRGHGTQDPAIVHFGLPLGSDHRYVVEVRFMGDDGKPGPVVHREVVPSEISGYRLLEITNCEEVNRPPVAKDVEVETRTGVEVRIRLKGTDPDGDPLDYFVVKGPRHGTLRGSGSTLYYKPDEDFEGEDSFTYKATDGRAESATARVEIEVECRPSHRRSHEKEKR